jgi:osmotically-inducible protein OsmY
MRTEIEKHNQPSMQRQSNLSWNRQRGGMKGRGPSSYIKSDKRILEQINDRLCDNPYLDASEMEVGIDNGVVILTGSVNSREDKRLAEEIAEEVTGVENVENRLHVTMRGV